MLHLGFAWSFGSVGLYLLPNLGSLQALFLWALFPNPNLFHPSFLDSDEINVRSFDIFPQLSEAGLLFSVCFLSIAQIEMILIFHLPVHWFFPLAPASLLLSTATEGFVFLFFSYFSVLNIPCVVCVCVYVCLLFFTETIFDLFQVYPQLLMMHVLQWLL